MSNKYVLGFAFNESPPHIRRVVLIEKKHGPTCLHGKLNGIGGRIEDGECIRTAMTREFCEETGVYVDQNLWQQFAIIHGDWGAIHCFRVTLNERKWGEVQTMTDEKVMKRYVSGTNSIHSHLAQYLDWLVPLALDEGVVPVIRVRTR